MRLALRAELRATFVLRSLLCWWVGFLVVIDVVEVGGMRPEARRVVAVAARARQVMVERVRRGLEGWVVVIWPEATCVQRAMYLVRKKVELGVRMARIYVAIKLRW